MFEGGGGRQPRGRDQNSRNNTEGNDRGNASLNKSRGDKTQESNRGRRKAKDTKKIQRYESNSPDEEEFQECK